MKRVLFIAMAVLVACVSVNAQVRVSSPHPKLEVKLKRAVEASGTLVIDLLLTNYDNDAEIWLCGSNGGYGAAIANDDEGNQYSYESKLGKIMLGYPSNLKDGNIFLSLLKETPVKYVIQIEGVDRNAAKMIKIRIPVGHSSGGLGMDRDREKYIEISNLEFEKR